MKILYVFPHPDDESFGPAGAIHAQMKQGHEVYLLTLTKGGATRQRFKLNLSIEEMGEVRYKEMKMVEKVLSLSGMEVLDLPDSSLKELDPRLIENILEEHIKKIKPDVLVSYPVHGISGFHDHLVMHAIAKRVYLEMKDAGADYLKRLAFFTLPDDDKPSMMAGQFRLKKSERELIDCIINLETDDREALIKCLSCYETYQETIEKTGVIEEIGHTCFFELFNEDFDPPLNDLCDQLK